MPRHRKHCKWEYPKKEYATPTGIFTFYGCHHPDPTQPDHCFNSKQCPRWEAPAEVILNVQ